ncbi:GDP-mannose 4,6-dehydratase [Acidimicrobiia bacterium]|jgi:GDPmannose 4,6-dehydratase|nr:GDP-mannose 4,6-dehydratase [Acidimicrobiia bacterium]MDB4834164.1 GDP-mannose 4,6-dehydratase [Acidimicrobiia bacterium]
MKKAFITGITGQDGYYLSKLLLDNNYEVHGTIRRSSSINTSRIDPLISEYSDTKQFNLHYSDLLDSASLSLLLNEIQPDEVYNLAAQSHVAVSFKNPVISTQTSTLGVLSLLEPLRTFNKEVKFYQASSSEMYGGSEDKILNEDSLFDPKSPYAAGKVFSHNLNKIYRESYDMFCVNGILFNHESPHRGETFVTRKISRAVGRIKLGLQSKLTLGNLEAVRDWGYAGDYVEGMWKMMQYDKPDDWVLATGKAYKVSDFAKSAFDSVNLNWEDFVVSSKRYERPNEVHYLLGDSSKAKNLLNWKPKVDFDGLVKLMVEEDIELAKQEKTLLDNNLIKPTWENAI